MNRPLPCPARRRQCPAQFSWVDQRLARERYFERAPASAWTLYLFLITVADGQGISYYAERSIAVRLKLTPAQLRQAREALIALDLVAYRAPVYQVLSLPAPPVAQPTTREAAQAHLAALRRVLDGCCR